MKKYIFIILAVTIIPFHAEASRSKHKEVFKPSNFLVASVAGVIGLSILADSIANYHEPYYSSSSYKDFYNKDQMVWIPGYYRTVQEKVWIPSRVERIWVEPIYEYRNHHGKHHKILLRKGYYEENIIPGHYEFQEREIWVEGRYQINGSNHSRTNERCVY